MHSENKKVSGKAEVIIESVGCGKFQVILTFCLFFLSNMSSPFTMLFMAFGNYNPGWRCNDTSYLNDSTIRTNKTNMMSPNFTQVLDSVDNKTSITEWKSNNTRRSAAEENTYKYLKKDNCPLFESCKNIEFDPTTSTIVTEWGLLCEKKWIPSIIISIQMAGVFVGSLLVGHLGDAFGRKPVVYGAVLANAFFNTASSFSVSWEMFAVIRFFLGLNCALIMCLYYVLAAEFVPRKWRTVLIGIPAWSINGSLMALTCMALKNWRYINIAAAVVGIIGFIPVVWMPESLRFLEVKNKTKKFNHAADKLARINKKQLPSLETLHGMTNSGENPHSVNSDQTIYNFLHLFKMGYAKYTIMLTIPWFSLVTLTYALDFGIKALYGHFYFNFLLTPLIQVPFCVLPIFIPNIVGRKIALLIFSGSVAICLLGAGILDVVITSESIKTIAIPALVFTAIVGLDGMWSTMSIFTMELYPTVIRGIIVSWGSTVGRVGSIVAPFLSPDQSQGLFISYTIMAVLMFISFGIILGLPETKGLPLKETMDTIKCEDDDGDDNDSVK